MRGTAAQLYLLNKKYPFSPYTWTNIWLLEYNATSGKDNFRIKL